MNEAAFGAGIIAFYVVAIAVWLWGLIDAARRPDADFTAAGQSKVLWVVLCVVLGALGSVIYLLAIRPKLRRTTTAV